MAGWRVGSWALFFAWLLAWMTVWGYRDEIASWLVPNSWWLVVRDVQIRSVESPEEDPRVLIDRDVNRDMYLDRVVTLRPVSGEGRGACTRVVDHFPLRKGDPFPVDLPTLRIMQGTPPESDCRLSPGAHVVDITWRLPIFDGVIALSQTKSSNIFNVGPVQ